jgi:hypothetical protein
VPESVAAFARSRKDKIAVRIAKRKQVFRRGRGRRGAAKKDEVTMPKKDEVTRLVPNDPERQRRRMT